VNDPTYAVRRKRLGATREKSAGSTKAFFVDAAAVLGAWAGALLAENTALGFLWRDQFSGIWEIGLARHVVVPMAVVGLAPASFMVAAGWRVATEAARIRANGAKGSRAAVRALALVFAAAAGIVAFAISNGRHFASPVARVPFVALAVAAGALFGSRVVPGVAAMVRRPAALGLIGVAVAVVSWLADDYVLPRLDPAFHATLFVTTLLGASLVALAGRADVLSPGRLADTAAVMMAATVVYCASTIGRAADVLARAANLRIVLVEHAPLLGAVVAVSTRVRPGETEAAAAASAPSAGPGEIARALDWTGRDWLLLTVDALRADHVSAYGYTRPTTPNIDAIARRGALFEAAYCPTPHTSYSVTSMMTGKYLRPLLALGMGQDSETWAQYLRQYGWRTAAFYPPAVFYIDENRFALFEEERLGFEYAKVEFADPALRERQVAEYLASAPADRPLFLWVHFFEPHEPYVMHPAYPFSGGPSRDVDAYDSEVATADDGVGRIVRLVRASRPGAVVVVTADHGEEFGDHGGRYHGTTVYEEQVRVPLVVEGQGVAPGARIATVVQTIDLLPTALSALGIPRPARLRGRDLGPVLAGEHGVDDGFAFAETDDYALAASGADRLVCQRRAAACALYDAREDPFEHHDIAPSESARAAALHGRLRATERDHGRFESAGGPAWPEALRRGLQGERDAALDVASLLDDADSNIRRKAAEVSFTLHADVAAPAVKRAYERDEDDEVRRWSALALVRMGEPVPPLAESLLRDTHRDFRRAAALALTERADPRGCDELATWWTEVAPDGVRDASDREPSQISVDLWHAKEMLAATTAAHCGAAVPSLLRALADVRARPYVADTLGALGDDRARSPLVAMLAQEPYVTTRPHEARALLALGARDWVGDPNPVTEVTLNASAQRSRILALVSDATASVEVSVGDAPAAGIETEGEVRTFDFPPGVRVQTARPVRLTLRASSGGVTALWLVTPAAPGPDAGDLIDRP
jgi:HEAT repeat protein